MDNLKIIGFKVATIKSNFEEVNKQLDTQLESYTNNIVTPDTLKDMKKESINLGKISKKIKEDRIADGKLWNAPFDKHKENCDLLIGKIDTVRAKIKEQTEVFDEQERQKKLDYAMEITSELTKANNLTTKFIERLETESWYTNVATSNKAIKEDIILKVNEQAKLMNAEIANEAYVLTQLSTSSKLANLSTELVLDDISYLIADYETMDILAVTTGINAVAMKRKGAEERAIAQAKEAIEKQAREDAEREVRKQIEAENKVKAEAEAKIREDLEVERRMKEKIEADRIAKEFKEEEKLIIIDEPIEEVFEEQVQFVTENNGFVSISDIEEEIVGDIIEDEMVVVQVTCTNREAIELIRDCTLNGMNARLL